MSEQTDTTALEVRRLALEERKLVLAEREVENARRAARTPEEVGLDLELRIATALADSPYLPDSIKGDKARIAAGLGVVRYARLLGADPYVLAQQIYVVHGRVGFATSFLIGLVNERAGLQGRIDWIVEGAGAALAVTACATTREGQTVQARVSLEQAKTWGWAGKSDPWRADPELMLRYRSALKLIRQYFGATVLGLQSVEEIRDSRTYIDAESEPAPRAVAPPAPLALPESVDEPEATPERVPETLFQQGAK